MASTKAGIIDLIVGAAAVAASIFVPGIGPAVAADICALWHWQASSDPRLKPALAPPPTTTTIPGKPKTINTLMPSNNNDRLNERLKFRETLTKEILADIE